MTACGLSLPQHHTTHQLAEGVLCMELFSHEQEHGHPLDLQSVPSLPRPLLSLLLLLIQLPGVSLTELWAPLMSLPDLGLWLALLLLLWESAAHLCSGASPPVKA